ncbi:hypothetical protein JCM19237_785 [Photobacterium aphoticum]|uniref:Lipoprotein n=1 Tax=Photobacterium aphoticum TaxID=754436 RepID=A0A090RM38_9GAMM|nr:hypothetical protein JCM19237_785 [Photobacterium aphoticum]
MKKSIIFFTLLSALFLNGCQLTHIEGELDGVNIKASTKDNDHHDHGYGNFCPPGQAKKGNC